MSKSVRGAIFAVGLVAGVALGLIFFVWAFPWFGDPVQNASYQQRWQQEHAQQEQESGDRHFWLRPLYGWIYAEDTLAQWMMAIFGVAATGVSIWAVILVRDTLYETREFAKAARDSAQVARDTFDVQRLAMVAADRAYVHHNGVAWISHIEETEKRIFWRLRPRWLNTGNTPARQVHAQVQLILSSEVLPGDFEFEIEQLRDTAVVTIAPHTFIESGRVVIWGDDLNAVKKGELHAYLWGILVYRDVFPGTPERITRFCVKAAEVTGNPTLLFNEKTNIVHIDWATYERNNCVDEDCA